MQFVALATALLCQADPLDQWYLRANHSFAFRGAAVGNAKFVAVGDSGSVATSSDGTNWVIGQSLTGYILLDIAFGAGRFVAVGEQGLLFSSTTGSNWFAHGSGTTNTLTEVTYGNGRFVAVGGNYEANTAVATASTNGIDWIATTLPALPELLGVCFGNGLFVAVGINGVTAVSADGVNWTAVTTPSSRLDGVNYGDNRFVSVGLGIAGTSVDGTNWAFSSVPFPFSGHHVQFGGGFFVAADFQGRIWSSTNGLLWQQRLASGSSVVGGVYANDSHWIVGRNIWQSEALSHTNTAPAILAEPQDVHTNEFNSFVLNVPCYSPGPVSYQWFRDGSPLSGENNSALVFNNAQVSQSGLYHTVLTNSFGAATSRVATVNIQTVPIGALDRWHWRNPAPSGNQLVGVAGTNGMLVAISIYGEIFTSVDRTNWVARFPPTRNFLHAVTVGNGVFVTVGDGGTILASSNAIDWQSVQSHTTNALYGVTYAGGKFVAVGTNWRYGQRGCILTSGDGRNWFEQSSGTNASLRGVTFGGGKYVAVGDDTRVATSTDGVVWTWTALPYDIYALNAVTYGAGVFVAVNEYQRIYTSTNGTTWRLSNAFSGSSRPLESVVYGDGVFLAGGNGFWRSTNGLNWTSVSGLSGVVCRFDGVFGLAKSGPTLAISTDGQNWSPPAPVTSVLDSFRAIVEHHGVTVVLGTRGKNVLSTDGIQWIQGNLVASNDFSDAISVGGLLVAAGGPIIATSVDATNWTVRPLATNTAIRSITYGNNIFVGVGSDVFTSVDTMSWIDRNVSSLGFDAVTFGNDVFVASGHNRVYTSTNGINWISRGPIVPGYAAYITFGNERFLAATAYTIATSSNGINWVGSTMPSGYNPVYSVAAGPGRFIAVGSQGLVLTSNDGTVWTRRDARSFAGFSRALFARNSFTIVGSEYAIMQCDPLVASPPTLLPLPERFDTYEGSSLSLQSFDHGSWPLRYQWFEDDAPIPGATNSVFDVLNCRFADSGSYHVVVSNSFGAVTSQMTRLIVRPADLRFFSIKNGVAELQLSGAFGRTYGLDTRETLNSEDVWVPVTNALAKTRPVLISHTNIGAALSRFYKTRLEP